MAKQRVSQFRKIESQKMLRDLKSDHENRKKQIEEEHKIELDNYNELMDKRYYELNEQYENNQKALIDQFENEVNKKIEEFNRDHPVRHKGSAEALDLQKKLEHVVKLKDYPKAHAIQQQINDLHKGEKGDFEEEKKAKLDREIEKLRLKQENEKNVYHKKMSQIFVEFKKNRALETEKIIQKYKNRLKDADNDEKCETNEFHRPLRTALKNVPYSSPTKKNTAEGKINFKGSV